MEDCVSKEDAIAERNALRERFIAQKEVVKGLEKQIEDASLAYKHFCCKPTADGATNPEAILAARKLPDTLTDELMEAEWLEASIEVALANADYRIIHGAY